MPPPEPPNFKLKISGYPRILRSAAIACRKCVPLALAVRALAAAAAHHDQMPSSSNSGMLFTPCNFSYHNYSNARMR